MTCRLSDFNLTGDWKEIAVGKDTVAIAPAKTKSGGLEGLIFMANGIFLGFTFSEEAAVEYATDWIANRKKVLQ